jgi:predicted SAM-dependent methyltransferase
MLNDVRLPWRGLLRVMAGGVVFGVSPAERDAVQALLAERQIAAWHRRGLRLIRRQLLTRPARLNLGSGRFRKDGFLNVDSQPEADVTLDLRRGLPFDSDCCEIIFSEHCFEHFDYPEPIGHLLRECLRVLQPGGMLLFSVPDTEWPLTDYRDGPQASYFKACIESAWHPAQYTTRLEHINYHFRQDSQHRFAYDFETAQKILGAVGFVDVRRRSFDPSLDSEHRRLGSLFVSAQRAG